MTTKRTILLIDDDALTRRSLLRTLGCLEYTILQAESPEQGLEILKNTTPVHLVICDQHMGDALGSDLLETIRVLYPDVVRVMMTSDQSREALVRAINNGNVRRMLYKPWDDDQLRALVRQYLGLPRTRSVDAPPKLVQRRPSGMMRIAAILGVGNGDPPQGGRGGT